MGDKVTVRYTGRLQDGTKFDGSVKGESFSFIVGSGDVIPGFSQAVIRMRQGEKKTVAITPENGYGVRDPHLERLVPLSVLPVDTVVNDQIQVEFDGVKMVARVVDIAGDTVLVDANHPLAGRILIFEIELVEMEPASKV